MPVLGVKSNCAMCVERVASIATYIECIYVYRSDGMCPSNFSIIVIGSE